MIMLSESQLRDILDEKLDEKFKGLEERFQHLEERFSFLEVKLNVFSTALRSYPPTIIGDYDFGAAAPDPDGCDSEGIIMKSGLF